MITDPSSAAASCASLGTYAWAFGQGVLVDLTPCVYPLIPITVSVFGAQGVSKGRALFLATSYVFGMATLYTSLGVVVALTAAGTGFGTWLGNPVVVLPLVAILLVLAASMFGAFDLQLPAALQTRLSQVGGTGPIGAFLMGLVSGFISAPCTGPVLLSLLGYIASSSESGGGVIYGGSLLFTYALGMGSLFFAVALGASLFRPGIWMEHVKSVFGLALVVMAFYFLRPISAPLRALGTASWGLWAGLALLGLGIGLGAVHRSFHGELRERVQKGLAVSLACVGACIGLNNFMHVELKANWQHIETPDELLKVMASAELEQRPVSVPIEDGLELP
jgi:thiol:disulfide interchange protein DsbD